MTDNIVPFPKTIRPHNKEVLERIERGKALDALYEYIEPIGVVDELISGLAKVEDLGSGLVRVWLYSEENLVERCKVIRAKLILPLERALEMNAQAKAAYEAITPLDEKLN